MDYARQAQHNRTGRGPECLSEHAAKVARRVLSDPEAVDDIQTGLEQRERGEPSTFWREIEVERPRLCPEP
jgi:hypothetical protein